MILKMSSSDLISSNETCCGCGACEAVCPTGAISMTVDASGYRYPEISSDKCIGCKRCLRVCSFKRRGDGENAAYGSYSAFDKEPSIMSSASGGVFGSLARSFIEAGGIVFGCANVLNDSAVEVRHVAASTLDELQPLLGSKYVQSHLDGIFHSVKNCLDKRPVLFSGTPCQVAALISFLGHRPSNLFTIDLVCHGTPNQEMLREYLSLRPHSKIARPVSVQFRKKLNGWPSSLLMEIIYSDNFEERICSDNSSYYDLFLKAYTYRDSCYACPFAGGEHPADLTIGDFWGVEKEFPDICETPSGKTALHNGLSCLLINSEKGVNLIERYGENLAIFPVEYEKIARHNDQLNEPACPPSDRIIFLDIYRRGGWEAVERFWEKMNRRNLAIKRIKSLIPCRLKILIKQLLGNV